MLKINSEYSIARTEDTLFLIHFGNRTFYTTLYSHDDKVLGSCSTICTKKYPLLYLTTQNKNEMILRQILPQVKGAVCKEKEIRAWMDEDPYGRSVQRGTYSYEVWDLSKLFEQMTETDMVFAGTNYINKYRLLDK